VKVAVTSTVVFEVPDDGSTLDTIRQRFYAANVFAIGQQQWTTVSGQPWVMLKIERFEIERRHA
jgi:hypothetical protein